MRLRLKKILQECSWYTTVTEKKLLLPKLLIVITVGMAETITTTTHR
jgi:hypothetical protein